METDQQSADESIDEPNAKRPKLESITSKSSAAPKFDKNHPFLSMPPDVLAKIIVQTPIPQWPELELLDKNFQASALIAWRQIRHVHVDRDFAMEPAKLNDRSSYCKTLESILQTLMERSAFLTSLSGIVIQSGNVESNSDLFRALAQFEHLQSISMSNNTNLSFDRQGIPLENVVEFLDATRSRASLKELCLFNVDHRQPDRPTMLDRFASAMASLKLETFSFTSSDPALCIRLETMDISRLTDVLVGKASIEPDQLSNLIERASNLRRIELSFLHCRGYCTAPRWDANKRLLTILASHENLTAMKFEHFGNAHDCECVSFVPEFIEMLKAIGRRGQLRQLAMDEGFLSSSLTRMTEIWATIRDHMTCLRSIKLYVMDHMERSLLKTVSSLTELEEIHFSNCRGSMTANTIKKIAQLSNLQRLSLDAINDKGKGWLKCLGDVETLADVRIVFAQHKISGDFFDKWTDGFASNLQCLMLRGIVFQSNDERGLIGLLAKAVRLRVLILHGRFTDQSLMAIAKSCPHLEICGLRSDSKKLSVRHLQEILDRCSKLKSLGGFGDDIRDQLQFPEYRKIIDVDMDFSKYDFDKSEYV